MVAKLIINSKIYSMILFAFLFYSAIGLLALYELYKSLDVKYIYKTANEYRQQDTEGKKGIMLSRARFHFVVRMDTLELLFTIVGLFTPYWPVFLLVSILSLSQIQRASVWLAWLDYLLTAGMYLYVIADVFPI